MDRAKIPCCSRCKLNYHITGEKLGLKIPMLLNCGHDICENCLNFVFKKNNQIICEICQTDIRITCKNELSNVPIHYYLAGKVFFLSCNKQKAVRDDINNLRMPSVKTKPFQNNMKNCNQCHKYATLFCHHCNTLYCENCSQKVHMANKTMYQHEFDVLFCNDPEISQKSYCGQHSKVIDIICVTCDISMCSTCAIDNHRLHDIQHLHQYNTSEVQRLNECTSKGNNLLKNLKSYRNKFCKKIQDCQNSRRKKKNNDYDIQKLNVSIFVSSVIGALQHLEHKFLYIIDQAYQVNINSIGKIISQLDNLIEDLQEKLNQIDSTLKKNQYLCTKMSPDTISDIERMLDMTYFIAKKNSSEISIIFNENIGEIIEQCIISEIDVSDTYILTEYPELPSNYRLTSTIDFTNNEIEFPERSLSVSSSISTISSDVSVSSTDIIATSKFSNLFAREISQNVVESVAVTNVNSPSDFYVQLLANHEIIIYIANELNKFKQTKQSDLENIEMDNMMYAIQACDNQWYRGFVVNINCNIDGDCLYTVFCIDYGFTDTVSADRIRKMPECLVSIPSLAYNCALYDLKPSTITGWTNEAYTLFTELVSEETGIFCIYPMDLSGEQIKVDLIWKECLYPLSIRDAMFFLGHGSSAEKFINKELHEELMNLINLPSNIQLEEGIEYPVVINHLITPFEFYMRIMDDETTNLLAEIMNSLDAIYKPTENQTLKNYLLYTPKIGMIVAARYSIDSSWYRAKITSLPEPRMVTVFYVDFGNSETLPWDQLRVLDKSLVKTPPLAVKASLTDIEPAIDGIECDKWSGQSCVEIMNMLGDDYVQNNLSALVHKINCDTHKVVLYKKTLRGEVCINSQLLNSGHATTLQPELCVFNKRNTRNDTSQTSFLMNSREKNRICSSENTLAFTKQRSVIESKSYLSHEINLGRKMSVIKFLSPDEIILKDINYNTADLTEIMNKVYLSKNNVIEKLDWKENNLCAVFVQKYGNWYRGKIIKLNKKKTADIYLYDLDETLVGVSLKNLNILIDNLAEETCGILHCCMDKLVPLGVMDGKWPKFSCDRLFEELKKYPHVYFSECGNRGNKVSGEIWVKSIDYPQALEPINERWINLNRFMIDQGLALNSEQASVNNDHRNIQSELEFNNTRDTLINNWLPPIPITSSTFNAVVTYVDKKGLLYFQCENYDTPQLLQTVLDELNSKFINSIPEKINFKWSCGQMVIAKYHLDNYWYRGIIVKIKKNDLFSVHFIDYGNTEDCSHENLRSTLYATEIPQLCVKGFLKNIIPVTKNQIWPTLVLDILHTMVVDKELLMTIDLEKSKENVYAIENLKSDGQFDVCQILVSNHHAYFTSVDKSKLEFFDYPTSNNTSESSDTLSVSSTKSGEHCANDKDCNVSIKSSYINDIEHEEINNRMLQSDYAEGAKIKSVEDTINTIEYAEQEGTIHREINNSTCNFDEHVKQNDNDEIDKINNSKNEFDSESDSDKTLKKYGYSKLCIGSNNEVEGTLSTVSEPIRMTLMVTKVDGVCLSKSKDDMHSDMFDKCPNLPTLKQFTPGTAVVVLDNYQWKRGLIVNNGDSIFLVDFGQSIKLTKKNIKLCPNEFFHLPMLSIDCELTNMKISENAEAKDVIQKMSKLLRGLKLKIIVVDKLGEDVIGVELYNNNEEIAYQSLIDNKLLIPKN